MNHKIYILLILSKNMVETIAVIPDPYLAYVRSIHRCPENLPSVPESLEKAASVAEGDLIFQRVASQLSFEEGSSSTRGFTHSFYPGRIQTVKDELCFVTLTSMPSHPPGYGHDHPPGMPIRLGALDKEEFYRLK